MNNDSDLIAFIGTSTPEERALLAPILERIDKLLYVYERVEGEVSYKNIICTNLIPHQLLEYPFYFFSGRASGSKQVLLYSNDPFEKASYNYLKKMLNSIGRSMSKEYKINYDTDMGIIVNDIKDNYCKTGENCYIFTIIFNYTESFFDEYTANGLDNSIHKVVPFDLSRRDTNEFKDFSGCANNYYISSYLSSNNNVKNLFLRDQIEKYKGNVNMILNEETVNMYFIYFLDILFYNYYQKYIQQLMYLQHHMIHY